MNVCVALVIEHTECTRHIVLSSVACLTVQHFSVLSHKRHDFRQKKKVTKRVCVCLLIFSTPCA